jgi:pimeloyl-ACP methyl ester carboxylesterase
MMKKIGVGLAMMMMTNWSIGQLLSDTLIATYTTTEIDSIYTASGLPSFVGDIIYDIEVYKLIYQTPDAVGGITYASGALFIPVGDTCNGPLIGYQHGTIANDANVPSRIGGEAIIGIIAATGGYRVTMTDYLGLGDGPGIHPYIHAKSEATSVIDMLRAGRQFCDSVNVPTNEQVFLMGYSQGGHATMATLREIEQYHSAEFDLVATIPMAGPYDVSGVQREVMESDSVYSQPAYFPYIALSYDMVYDVYDSLEQVFIPPYDSIVPEVFDRNTNIGYINGLVTPVIKDMIDTTYFNAYLNDSLHPFKIALRDNDLYDFVPQSYVRIIHCSGDQVIPFGNAQVAYDAFIAAGADSVELFDAGGSLDHGPCAQFAIIGAKIYIDSRAKWCMVIGEEEEQLPVDPQVKVTPNPFSAETELSFSNPNNSNYILIVQDLSGRLVKTVPNIRTGTIKLNWEGIDKGIYFFRLSGEQEFSGTLVAQ